MAAMAQARLSDRQAEALRLMSDATIWPWGKDANGNYRVHHTVIAALLRRKMIYVHANGYLELTRKGELRLES